jgi:hypothetical protein
MKNPKTALGFGLTGASMIPFGGEANKVMPDGTQNFRSKLNEMNKLNPPPLNSGMYGIDKVSNFISGYDRTFLGRVVNKTPFNSAMTPPVFDYLNKNKAELLKTPMSPDSGLIDRDAMKKGPPGSMAKQGSKYIPPSLRQIAFSAINTGGMLNEMARGDKD